MKDVYQSIQNHNRKWVVEGLESYEDRRYREYIEDKVIEYTGYQARIKQRREHGQTRLWGT